MELGTLMGFLAERYTDTFLSAYQEYYQVHVEQVLSDDSPHARLFGLLLADSVLEFGKEHISELCAAFLPFFLNDALNEDFHLRQASLFGLGLIIQMSPPNCDADVSSIVDALIEVHYSSLSTLL